MTRVVAMKKLLTAKQSRYLMAGTLGLCAAGDESHARQCCGEVDSHLETSSYSGAMQGEPIRGFTHIVRRQTVTSELPFESDFGVRGFQ